jgi:hypothetical protein
MVSSSLLRCMSPFVCRFLGRLDDESIHVHRREASEKRQGTKSRLVGRLPCRELDEGLMETRTLMRRDGTWRDANGAFKQVMPSPLWNQPALRATRACWHGS